MTRRRHQPDPGVPVPAHPHHPWLLRRGAAWRWWAPWRWELICRRCVITYPCPSLRYARAGR